ncbi:MAG: hypothetical protein K2X27_12995 [Candidatus Obscuribacterales bacterium]|nr:hypothetical protein [Candidatus Obscuribacterales bacterium]
MAANIIKRISSPLGWRRRIDRVAYPLRRALRKPFLPKLSDDYAKILANLERDAIHVCRIQDLQLPETEAFWADVEKLKAEVRNEPSLDLGGYFAEDIYSYHVPYETISVKGPNFILWALSNQLLDLTECYLGEPACLIAVDYRRDLNQGADVGNRKFHVDILDVAWRRALKVCVYLSDVDENTPALEYVPENLLPPRSKVSRGFFYAKEIEEQVPKSKWVPVYGPKGTVIISPLNRLWHHARTPDCPDTTRYSAWFTYTSRDNLMPSDRKNDFSRKAFDLIENSLNKRQRESLWWYGLKT